MKLLKKIITLNSKKITKSFCIAEPLKTHIKNKEKKNIIKTNSIYSIYRDILKRKKEREEELEELNLKNDNLKLKVPSNLMMKMINSVQTKEDFEILLDAFYNFTGFENNFSQTIKDSVTIKGIKTNSFDLVLEFYENSMWLIYFPHFNTTESLVKKIVEENNYEVLFKLSGILKKNNFIKVNQEVLNILNDSVDKIEEENREQFSENVKYLNNE